MAIDRERIEEAIRRVRRAEIQPEPRQRIHCYYCGRDYMSVSAFGWHVRFYH